MTMWMWGLIGLAVVLLVGWMCASSRADDAEARLRLADHDRVALERQRAKAEGLEAALRIASASHAAEHELVNRLLRERS